MKGDPTKRGQGVSLNKKMAGEPGSKSTFEALMKKSSKGGQMDGSMNLSRIEERAAEVQIARKIKEKLVAVDDQSERDKSPPKTLRKRSREPESSRSLNSQMIVQVLTFNSSPSIYLDVKNTMMSLEGLVFERDLEHLRGRKTSIADDIKLHGHRVSFVVFMLYLRINT